MTAESKRSDFGLRELVSLLPDLDSEKLFIANHDNDLRCSHSVFFKGKSHGMRACLRRHHIRRFGIRQVLNAWLQRRRFDLFFFFFFFLVWHAENGLSCCGGIGRRNAIFGAFSLRL